MFQSPLVGGVHLAFADAILALFASRRFQSPLVGDVHLALLPPSPSRPPISARRFQSPLAGDVHLAVDFPWYFLMRTEFQSPLVGDGHLADTHYAVNITGHGWRFQSPLVGDVHLAPQTRRYQAGHHGQEYRSSRNGAFNHGRLDVPLQPAEQPQELALGSRITSNNSEGTTTSCRSRANGPKQSRSGSRPSTSARSASTESISARTGTPEA